MARNDRETRAARRARQQERSQGGSDVEEGEYRSTSPGHRGGQARGDRGRQRARGESILSPRGESRRSRSRSRTNRGRVRRRTRTPRGAQDPGRLSAAAVARHMARSPSIPRVARPPRTGSHTRTPSRRRTAEARRRSRSRTRRHRRSPTASRRRTSRPRSRTRRNRRTRSRSGRSTKEKRSRSKTGRSRSRSTLKRMQKKIDMLERKGDNKWEYKSVGIKKQAEFNAEVKDWVVGSLRDELEKHFEVLPDCLEKVLKAGEFVLDERTHTLKLADEFGWSGLATFQKEELARNDKEEKRIMMLRKEKKEREQKLADRKANMSSRKKFGNTRKTDWDRSSRFERRSRERDRYDSKVVENETASTAGFSGPLPRGPRLRSSVSTAKESVTMPETVSRERKGTQEGSEEENGPREEEDSPRVGKFYFKNKNDMHSDGFFLDNLEGVAEMQEEYLEELEGVSVKDMDDKVSTVVGSLFTHKHEWKKMGAGKMTMNIIETGLTLNFTKGQPGKYQEPNNKSCLTEAEFAEEEVIKLINKKVVREVSKDEVLCINPLSVASNRQGKKRLCIDLSRHVNQFCSAKKFRIESVTDFQKSVKKGSWMFSFDLKSAFHHLLMNKAHRKFLGFQIRIKGVERVFCFEAMPFGYNDASRILTKVLRTPVIKWRKEGLPVYIHIDDGLGIGATREAAQTAADVVREDLCKLGLITSPEKCIWEPTQRLTWCGFVWDTLLFKVWVQEDKLDRMKNAAQELLSMDTATAKQVAAFAGLVISCTIALGRNARFRTRMLSIFITSVVEEFGWKGFGVIPDSVKEELRFWIENINELNGQDIRKPAAVTKFDSFGFSDAGGHQLGGFLVDKFGKNMGSQYKVHFTTEEESKSSTFRELRGIEEGLRLHKDDLRDKSVRWSCDNWSAVKACELGSTKYECMLVAVRIAEWVEELNIKLEVVWKRRNTDEIVICDRISKDFDMSEYRLTQYSFECLDDKHGPLCKDWFASSWTARLDRFASRFNDKGTETVDAFSGDWSHGWGFFNPPIEEVARVLEKAEAEQAAGILLVPDWPGSHVCSMVELAFKCAKLREIVFLEYESAAWINKKVFEGVPSFGTRVYELGSF